MKLLFAGLVSALLAGCAVTAPPDAYPITNEQREFVYEFAAPGKSQKELFSIAREYFALTYGNSKDVTRIEDEANGTIIGRAVVPWEMSTGSTTIPSFPCASNYGVIYVAKEGRARLQLTLQDGAAMATCQMQAPPKRDYPQIVQQFQRVSAGLRDAIGGNSPVDKLRNF